MDSRCGGGGGFVMLRQRSDRRCRGGGGFVMLRQLIDRRCRGGFVILQRRGLFLADYNVAGLYEMKEQGL